MRNINKLVFLCVQKKQNTCYPVMFTVSGFLIKCVFLCSGTQLTSTSCSRSLKENSFRVDTLQQMWDKSPPATVNASASSPFVSLLGRHTATRVCGKLAGASSVVLQALQDALGQNFDVSVRLWVCVNKLQLLQAALLQEHAAVTSGCKVRERKKVTKMLWAGE